LHTAVQPLRGRLALGAALVALLAGALALPGVADANTNNTDCRGSVKAGEKSIDFENPLAYRIACSNYITSYSIVTPGRSITGMETEVFGIHNTTGDVIPTDAFSCNGDVPGWGINCVGTYGGGYNVLPGLVDIDGDVCAADAAPISLVVSYATYVTNPDGSPKLSSGIPAVTTSTAGPFELKVKGCSTPATGKAATTTPKHRKG
jgi:hypothetical protein